MLTGCSESESKIHLLNHEDFKAETSDSFPRSIFDFLPSAILYPSLGEVLLACSGEYRFAFLGEALLACSREYRFVFLVPFSLFHLFPVILHKRKDRGVEEGEGANHLLM
jgi:hypothetical protein